MRADFRDFLALIGLIGLAVGFALVWLPLGIIVPSGLLFWLGVSAARLAAREVIREHPG
jgi:hypothetical protein